jgi:hypothetical protein
MLCRYRSKDSAQAPRCASPVPVMAYILRAGPPGGLPTGLDDAVLLHLPECPVQGPRVRRPEPEHPRPPHELVTVGVPPPERQQDHRHQPLIGAAPDPQGAARGRGARVLRLLVWHGALAFFAEARRSVSPSSGGEEGGLITQGIWWGVGG